MAGAWCSSHYWDRFIKVAALTFTDDPKNPLNLTGPGEAAAAASFPDRIDPAVEARLWKLWKAGEASARSSLVELYVPYTRALAARSYARRVHNSFEFNEYFHFAVIGMMEALDRFSPDRGVQFKTFATLRIQGAILNGLEKLSEQQQQVALRQRLAGERAESLAAEKQLQRGDQLLHDLGEIGVGLALGFILEGTGMVMSPEQSMPDNAYANLEAQQLRGQLWQLVNQITEREAQVVRMHYQQQHTFEEISMALRLTKGRVSQLHRQALERLRRLWASASSSKKIDVAL